MTIRSTRWVTAILVLTAAASLSADRVRLRSGKAVEGMFIGGDSKSIRVLLDNGQVTEIPLAEAVAVDFAARKAAPPASPPPEPAAPPKAVTVPAGTIAGGGSGAAIGAAVGGVTGAAVASGGEEHLTLPAETRLQFQLSAAVSIRP